MRVTVISGARSPQLMGLELAEFRLLDALRSRESDVDLAVRVVGGRSARRYARRLDGRWIPARRGRLPSLATARAGLVHLIGLDLPPPRREPFVAMVHDLSTLHFDDEGTLPPWFSDIVERASLLLTPSAFTVAELYRHFNVPTDRTRIISGAPALEARDAVPLSPDELRAYGIEPPVVLRYGGYTKRKNVPLLLDAWASVRRGTLVLAGPRQPARDSILAAAPTLNRVVVLDYVPQALLARLLRTSSALVSTSSYEGFGLPLLEALAAGTPAVAVSTPFVREVCAEAAVLVDTNADALALALTRILDDDDFASAARQAGLLHSASFSWDRSARRVLAAYETLTA